MGKMQLICEDRLKKMLFKEKRDNPQYILNVLKSDLLLLLSNYMDIKADTLSLDIAVLENGVYKIFIEGYAKRLKIVRHV